MTVEARLILLCFVDVAFLINRRQGPYSLYCEACFIARLLLPWSGTKPTVSSRLVCTPPPSQEHLGKGTLGSTEDVHSNLW